MIYFKIMEKAVEQAETEGDIDKVKNIVENKHYRIN